MKTQDHDDAQQRSTTRRCFTYRVKEHDELEFGVIEKDEGNVQQ